MDVNQSAFFRWWYYARQGYQVYFAFAFIGINTLTVTYYLAIEQAPFLKAVFPTFLIYVVISLAIGMPILVLTGFFHYKKMPAYKSEAEVNVENNPYQYKLPPGYWLRVIMPYFLAQSKIMTKLSKNEKISDNELNEITEIQKKMEHLIKGGYVGIEGKQVSFGNEDDKKNPKNS